MNYWKPKDVTLKELDRLDQFKHYDVIYTLKHSPAAIMIFHRIQLLGNSDEVFHERITLAGCISEISCDVVHNPMNLFLWNTPWHARGVTAVQVLNCADDLGYETKLDEYYDKTLHRTLLGWVQI